MSHNLKIERIPADDSAGMKSQYVWDGEPTEAQRDQYPGAAHRWAVGSCRAPNGAYPEGELSAMPEDLRPMLGWGCITLVMVAIAVACVWGVIRDALITIGWV